jgi:hypothetical protein
MIDWICQVALMVFGGIAIWLVGRLEHWRRWGYVFGLLGQPFWIYTALYHKQWGVLALSLWYTYSWGQGVYNYWRRDGGKVKPDDPVERLNLAIVELFKARALIEMEKNIKP